MLGSVFSFYILNNLVVTIIISSLTLVFILILAVVKKKVKYFLVPILSFAVGVSMFFICSSVFNKDNIAKPDVVSGRICTVDQPSDGCIKIVIDECKFDSKKVNSNLTVYVYDSKNLFTDMEIGNIIEFEPSSIYKTNLFDYEMPNSYCYADNLRYGANVNLNKITVVGRDVKFVERIRQYIKDNLSLGLTNENIEIAYSALFGDKEFLSSSQYDNYKLAGVAHLLAVSGLHVGIIVGVLNFLCDKVFKIKHKYKLILTSIFLLAYVILCDFSVSVIRASIMSICIMLAFTFKREPDPLSSLSLAGIIIFLINPFIVFDVSFLMSFSCIMGIIMLNKPIASVIDKTNNNAILKAFSISLATSVSLMVIMAYFFNNLNVISLLANIILIPIFGFVFTIIFIVSMLSLIIPQITILLTVTNPILDFINLTSNVLGNLPISNFQTIGISFFSIIIYFFLCNI